MSKAIATPITNAAQLLANAVLEKPDKKRAQTPEEYRKNYTVMHIGVGPSREEKYQKVMKLCEHYNCRESVVVWAALDMILANPPKTIEGQESAPQQAGTAAGFHLVPTREGNNPDGKATKIEIKEVQHRFLIRNGCGFFTFKPEDGKARKRAFNQAVKAAAALRKMAGLPSNPPENLDNIVRLEYTPKAK